MSTSTLQPPSFANAPAWLNNWLRLLIFLFPVTVATLGWGTVIFVLLLLPALYYGRGWSALQLWERRLLLGFVVVLAAMALSMVNGEELREGLKGLDRYLRFVLLLPVYLMLRRFRLNLGREFALGALVACALMMVQAVYQVQWQGHTVATGHYHKIVFGDLAVWWGGVAALYAMVVINGGAARLGIGLLIGMALYASLLSQTRGAWLFVPVVALLLLWLHWQRVQMSRRALLLSLAMLLGLAAAVGTQSESLKSGIQRGYLELQAFEQHPEAFTSWGVRLNLWRNAMLIVQESPLLGTGVGDFQTDMRRMVEDGRSLNPYVGKFGHAHSIYFDSLAKGGVVGFLAMLTGLLLLPFIAFVKGVRRTVGTEALFYAGGGLLLIAAFATFGLSEGLWTRNPFVNTYVVSLLVFMTGMANHDEQQAT